MVRFWYRRVMRGKSTIDEVPWLWRDKVRRLLEADEAGEARDGGEG